MECECGGGGGGVRGGGQGGVEAEKLACRTGRSRPSPLCMCAHVTWGYAVNGSEVGERLQGGGGLRGGGSQAGGRRTQMRRQPGGRRQPS